MSTVDQGKHRVRRNGDIMYRFAHTQGRGVPGDFEDDGPRWVCVGSVQAVSGGWRAQKAPTMNTVVGGLKIRTRRRDAVAELLGALGLSSTTTPSPSLTSDSPPDWFSLLERALRDNMEVAGDVVVLRRADGSGVTGSEAAAMVAVQHPDMVDFYHDVLGAAVRAVQLRSTPRRSQTAPPTDDTVTERARIVARLRKHAALLREAMAPLYNQIDPTPELLAEVALTERLADMIEAGTL